MKSTNILIWMGWVSFLILQSCGSDESPSKEEVQLKKLSHTWQLVTAEKDNVAEEGFDNFELTFAGSSGSDVFTYGTVGRPDLSPWPAGGTWVFGSTVTTRLIRDPGTEDELDIDYNLTDSTLELVFYFGGDGYSTGRVKGTEGHWVFTFTKQ